jgi:hypothetical protein
MPLIPKCNKASSPRCKTSMIFVVKIRCYL